MTRLGLLGTAALVLSSALAAPAMAQQAIENPGLCAQFDPNANCRNEEAATPAADDYQRRAAFHNSYNRWDGDRSSHRAAGFWRGDAAGFSGTVETAPIRSDSYAWEGNGGRGLYDQGYAQRNGFVCQPGTWFRGEDGLLHICQ